MEVPTLYIHKHWDHPSLKRGVESHLTISRTYPVVTVLWYTDASSSAADFLQAEEPYQLRQGLLIRAIWVEDLLHDSDSLLPHYSLSSPPVSPIQESLASTATMAKPKASSAPHVEDGDPSIDCEPAGGPGRPSAFTTTQDHFIRTTVIPQWHAHIMQHDKDLSNAGGLTGWKRSKVTETLNLALFESTHTDHSRDWNQVCNHYPTFLV